MHFLTNAHLSLAKILTSLASEVASWKSHGYLVNHVGGAGSRPEGEMKTKGKRPRSRRGVRVHSALPYIKFYASCMRT